MKYKVKNITEKFGIGNPLRNVTVDFEVHKKKYTLAPGEVVALATEKLTGKLLQLRIKGMIEIETQVEEIPQSTVIEEPIVEEQEVLEIEAVDALFTKAKKNKKDTNVFLQKK